ncbi:MAG: HigA family addiction module antidote protein [Magnetococcales bacterium]|nr:HigA family addiction module antidote protein [Magnetococcales bacterium]NGZ25505.1 HigA family addiction module antidote protein [Magnetococcales bacterium]
MTFHTNVPHPGHRIKLEVIPVGMTITQAANLLAVGRPALSNLLNGKAALSPEMATRLANAFNFPLKKLMDMQTNYEEAQTRKMVVPPGTRNNIPPFLQIKANEIESWSKTLSARSRLAVFLRTLVNSTGRNLTKADFPGNEDAQRHGRDGFVEADQGTPWIPAGRSVWEFSIEANPNTKAEKDFDKRTKEFNSRNQECGEITFIFVTLHRWTGKDGWSAQKKAMCQWKDVRAYDASDIEQWLEQSLPAQAWFANEINWQGNQVRTLDKCWTDWSEATEPHLNGSLFSPAIETNKEIILKRLSSPPENPIFIAADSAQEGLAFLSQLLGEQAGEELAIYRDKVIVFDQPGIFPKLAVGAQSFIAVSYKPEIDEELAPHLKTTHLFRIYPHNTLNIKFDITLGPTNYDTFHQALKLMGMERDRIAQLMEQSGRSLTVLRRLLSKVPAIRTPAWAFNPQTAKNLIPFLFVGAWDSKNETDKAGLSLLADDLPYEQLERECQNLTLLEDAPLWSIDRNRGVVSKFDLLHAIAHMLTEADLNRFFEMASMILGEDDPLLDLSEEQRWAALFRGKNHAFSSAFRAGILETLVLLSVHGGTLFKERLGVDTEVKATLLIRGIFKSPISKKTWETQSHALTSYAEAAPDEFLSILERDLNSNEPTLLELFRPMGSSLFGNTPNRTGLLWALEGLSWNPQTLPRAALILARLSQIPLNDNWLNKPFNSLKNIFRSWMPQTAADHPTRIALMQKLKKEYPAVAWHLCVEQFGDHDTIGHYNHKFCWRSEGMGCGEPISTWEPIRDFVRQMVEMALTWEEHSLDMLCDLVKRLHRLSGEHQARVWSLVEGWALNKASDRDKATMRETIRVSFRSRRAKHKLNDEEAVSLSTTSEAVIKKLESNDILNKHAWLFQNGWIDESTNELENIDELDFDQRQEHIKKLRTDALQDIFTHQGLAGILALSERGETSRLIGNLLAHTFLTEQEVQDLLCLALAKIVVGNKNLFSYKNLVVGLLQAVADDSKRLAILNSIISNQSQEAIVQLLLLAPFGQSTWNLVDLLGESITTHYWSSVDPDWLYYKDDDIFEAVTRLLEAKRPCAAFFLVKYKQTILDAPLLFRLLSEMAKAGGKHTDEYLPDSYDIRNAFQHLNNSPALTLDQKASLEFTYVEVLSREMNPDQEDSGIPNLERYIEEHPETFVQAIVWSYKRNDDAPDPDDFIIPPESVQTMASRCYTLLTAIQRIPGHDNFGKLSSDLLQQWIATVRKACTEFGRTEIGDQCIGKLLSHAPVGQDGIWPCEPVREVMEDIKSEAILSGASIGIYNSRGVYLHTGGNQEREMAQKYRKWATALQISHPFVSSMLLMKIAKTYENEANAEILEMKVNHRLR